MVGSTTEDEIEFKTQLEEKIKKCKKYIAEAKCIFKENLISALLIVYNLKL